MNLLRARQHDALERRLQEARVLVARLLDERDLARNERDDALAEAHQLRQAAGHTIWRAIAERNGDEATAYAAQLVAAGIEPDRDYGRAIAGSAA